MMAEIRKRCVNHAPGVNVEWFTDYAYGENCPLCAALKAADSNKNPDLQARVKEVEEVLDFYSRENADLRERVNELLTAQRAPESVVALLNAARLEVQGLYGSNRSLMSESGHIWDRVHEEAQAKRAAIQALESKTKEAASLASELKKEQEECARLNHLLIVRENECARMDERIAGLEAKKAELTKQVDALYARNIAVDKQNQHLEEIAKAHQELLDSGAK